MKYQIWQTDASALRTLFRMYFIIVLFFLSIIGRQVAKCAAKVELLKGNPVSLHRMTGWLHANDIGIVIWKLHRLPGGWWLGLMMIITSIITIMSDLLVTRLINPLLSPALCPFSTGLIMNWDSLTWSVPPTDGYPALVAANAQIPVDPDQCQVDDDLMGGWACTDVEDDQQWTASDSLQGIGDWLVQNGLQYSNWSYTDVENGSGATIHVVFWSSSADSGTSGKPFDVRVSVDMSISVTDAKTFKTYNCTIVPSKALWTDPLNAILSKMNSYKTLSQWSNGLGGVIYMGDWTAADPSTTGPSIEQYLNTLTMVEGGSNGILNAAMVGDMPYYGCLTSQAQIHTIIFFLIAFARFIFLATLIYCFMLLARLSTHFLVSKFRPESHTDSISDIKPVPDSTLSWILQAAREDALETEHMSTGYRNLQINPVSGLAEEARTISNSSVVVPSQEYELRDWRFQVVDGSAGIARVVGRHVKAVSSVMSSPEPQQQGISAYGENAFSPNSYAQPDMGISTQQQQGMTYQGNGVSPNIYEQ
ncbi:hypothetical protein V8E51_013888 [Hyaloscypha variabilis]